MSCKILRVAAPPLATHFAVGLWALDNVPHMSLRESTERPILPPFRRSPAQRARGGRRKAAYKTAPKAPHQPSARRAVAPSTQPAAERRTQPFVQRAKPLAAKLPLNPYAHRRVKKYLQSMDFLCIIRTIIKHKARGPAYFGMQAFSILEVAVMILHYGEG